MAATTTVTTTIQITIKGVEHILSLEEARELVMAVSEAITPKIGSKDRLEKYRAPYPYPYFAPANPLPHSPVTPYPFGPTIFCQIP